MKKLVNFIAMCASVIISVGSMSAAIAGNGASGGLYKYYYTSGAHLNSVKNYIFQAIKDSPPAELEALSQKYSAHMHTDSPKQIDWSKFAAYVKQIKGDDGTAAPKKINPQGFKDTLVLTYTANPPQVIALEEFYKLFHKTIEDLTLGEAIEMERMLAHETSHLFGLGTQDDDDISQEFSIELLSIINRYWYRCSPDAASFNIANCKYTKPSKATSPGPQKIRLSMSGLMQGGVLVRPYTCQYQITTWRAKYQIVAPGIIKENWDNLSTVTRPNLPVIETKEASIAEFDISNLQPGDTMTLDGGCSEGNGNSKIKFKLTDDHGVTLFDDSHWEVKINAERTFVKMILIKTDSGSLIFKGARSLIAY